MSTIHIACGLRCHTKKQIPIRQESLPFDSGFFTQESVQKMLRAKKLKINLENTVPCIKKEGFPLDDKKGFYFKTSTYEKINEYIAKNGYDNQYLDITNGYYTYLKDYDCVLAHYNWHPSSGKEITNPVENLKIIEETLNRRLERLLDMIRHADHIHLYWSAGKQEQFIQIDQKMYHFKKEVVKRKLLSVFSFWKNKKITLHFV